MIKIEVADSIATVGFEQKEPICANDVDDFDRLMTIKEKPKGWEI